MANTFKNTTTKGIGSVAAVVYTSPPATKTIVIGLALANIYGSTLPVRIFLTRADSTVVELAESIRIDGGVTFDFISGKKLVLLADESISVASPVDQSFDCVVSVLEGVD